MPRKVKFCERYKKPEFNVDKGCRINRNNKNFCESLEKYPDIPTVQIYSVIGEKGGNYLLTIHFVKCNLILAFLRDANTSKSVTDIYDALLIILRNEEFIKLFQLF